MRPLFDMPISIVSALAKKVNDDEIVIERFVYRKDCVSESKAESYQYSLASQSARK